MNSYIFTKRLELLESDHKQLLTRRNEIQGLGNGIYDRWQYPVITAEHIPLNWRYDLDQRTNPYLMERLGVNAAFNAGAIYFNGRFVVVVRVEGYDRKSFFAVAESDNGVDNFHFWGRPIDIPETEEPDTNIYDMRLTQHEDGYIYGLFCTERKDSNKPNDTSAAIAQCGIARTKDLVNWQRLPDLVTNSGQQRNVVLHPEFVDGQYALYTRPQDGFIDIGGGGGIGWGLTRTMDGAKVEQEQIIHSKAYHTIYELKNGQGPTPIRTRNGWLHMAHGVRNTADGLRYVLYSLLTDLDEPWRITHSPGGYLIAPEGSERVGDVSNVVFCNGWIRDNEDNLYIYYASSDTRLHVATTTVERLLDYCTNTPADGLTSACSVRAINELIDHNAGRT
ncbi:glycoside hydrolase family 130 protein [Alteromonas oceanisediminis]|uniref:glycoside hydrolase family 130 protein n=1 Tax=Alteromonas oceanisediminis TaxID=2836180 RepID=UPI001BDADE75|nr:glycosidase [Alteromonas oceanisediminis]MBT0586821.1 glycosidase [Alteromonas oceanisediminis]